MKSIYIAGPMRGITFYNFPAFDAARDALEAAGWEVVSPADMDRNVDGFDPATRPVDFDWNRMPAQVDFGDCVTRDLDAVRYCDAIFMLEGWQESKGARAELAVADWLGKEIIHQTKGNDENDARTVDGIRRINPEHGSNHGGSGRENGSVERPDRKACQEIEGAGCEAAVEGAWSASYGAAGFRFG